MIMQKRWAASLLAVCLVLVLASACGRNRGEEAAPSTEAPPTAAPAPATESNAASGTESSPDEESSPEEATAEEAPAAGAATGGDATSVVGNAMLAQMSGGPFRAITTIDADGTVTDMISEVIPPDTMHVTIGGGNMELILIDGTLWSKSGEAPWMQMGGTQMMEGIMDAIRGQTDASNLNNVQQVGSEPVFGVQTDVYAFTSTLGEGESLITSEVKVWIAQDSGLPVRMESSSVTNGVTTTTIQTIEYDDSITIAPPTP